MASTKPPSKRIRWILFAVVAAGFAATVFFGFAAVRSAVRLKAGIEQRRGGDRWKRWGGKIGPEKLGVADLDAIRGWMTIPHIAKLFDLPEADLYEDLAIPPADNDKKSLQQLNMQYFSGKHGYLAEKVKEAVLKRLELKKTVPQAQERSAAP